MNRGDLTPTEMCTELAVHFTEEQAGPLTLLTKFMTRKARGVCEFMVIIVEWFVIVGDNVME